MSAKNPLCDTCVLFMIQCSGHLTQCEERQMWMARKEMKEREGCDCVHTCKHAIIDFSHDNKTDYCVLSTDCPHKKKTMEKQIFQIIGLLNDLVSLSTIYSEEDVYNEVHRADLNLDDLETKLNKMVENLHRGK